jgi:hypothetical protein
MHRRVTDMTRRLALSARLLVIGFAVLLGASPHHMQAWAEAAGACRIERAGAPEAQAARFGVSSIASEELVATSATAPSDGEKSVAANAPSSLSGGMAAEKADAGHPSAVARRQATAFEPRGPPAA